MRFPSETDQRNPVIDILVISAMVPLNVLQATIPLLAPHDLHPAIEVVGDHPVEFVFAHSLDAGLQPIGLAAEPLNCRPALTDFILKTFAQGALDQFKSSIIESQLPQQAGESLLQDLLADAVDPLARKAGTYVIAGLESVDVPAHCDHLSRSVRKRHGIASPATIPAFGNQQISVVERDRPNSDQDLTRLRGQLGLASLS